MRLSKLFLFSKRFLSQRRSPYKYLTRNTIFAVTRKARVKGKQRQSKIANKLYCIDYSKEKNKHMRKVQTFGRRGLYNGSPSEEIPSIKAEEIDLR